MLRLWDRFNVRHLDFHLEVMLRRGRRTAASQRSLFDCGCQALDLVHAELAGYHPARFSHIMICLLPHHQLLILLPHNDRLDVLIYTRRVRILVEGT